MCKHCLAQCTKSEIEQPKDELWALFCAAYEQYQLEVISDKKLFQRFVNDFISFHLPVFSDDSNVIREHTRNLSNVYELLTEREDLVAKYFTKASFTLEDFKKMIFEFNHVENVNERPSFIAQFNEDQIRLITQFANEAHLFEDDVDEETIKAFFMCTLDHTLYVKQLRPVLTFFYSLSKEKMVRYNWQKLIANHKLLTPCSTMKPSKAGAIRSRYSAIVSSLPNPLGEPYASFIKKLKEMN